MKKLLCLLAISTIVFAVGCTEAAPTVSDTDILDTDIPDTIEEIVDPIPEDYVGVWFRTATYINGALEHNQPATWTLNPTNYTSTGDCINTGKVMAEGGNAVTITLDSTSCENVSTGINVTFTYEIVYDEERDVEVMTVVTGPMREIYDRESWQLAIIDYQLVKERHQLYDSALY